MRQRDACRLATVLLAVTLASCGKDAPPAGDAPAMAPAPAAPAAAATGPASTGLGATGPGATPAAAPASTTNAPAAAGDTGTPALLQAYLAAWNAHDIAAASMFFDEQGDYFDVAFAGLQHGRAAIAENAIGVFMRGVPDLHWELRSPPIVGPQGIAYEWTLTGTNTGTWGGVRATGQKIQLKGVSFMRVRNGKILYQSTVYDSAALNRQLGL
jgi:steroid delta-isomerase-like uncharacterized protein